jgi:mono/diheme cytochrome c family protein
MIKRPALLLTILLITGLAVIVIYKVQTDPFKNDPQAMEQVHSSDPVYMLYLKNCVNCHGRAGQGQSGFPSLQQTKLNVDEIKQLITTGRGKMPAFPQISEPHLSQLAEMVKQFSD